MGTKNLRYHHQFNPARKVQYDTFNWLQTWPREKLTQPEAPGKWSAIQVLDHLYQSQNGVYKYYQKKLRAEFLPVSTPMSWLRGRLLKFYLLSPFKFKAPSVLPQPENEGDLEKMQRQMQDLNTAFDKLIEMHGDRMKGRAIFRHPLMGRISFSDTLGFFHWHWKHHLRQLKRIEKAVLAE